MVIGFSLGNGAQPRRSPARFRVRVGARMDSNQMLVVQGVSSTERFADPCVFNPLSFQSSRAVFEKFLPSFRTIQKTGTVLLFFARPTECSARVAGVSHRGNVDKYKINATYFSL